MEAIKSSVKINPVPVNQDLTEEEKKLVRLLAEILVDQVLKVSNETKTAIKN